MKKCVFCRVQEIDQLEAHLNALYKHFYYFVQEYELLKKEEYTPLEALTRRICTD